jgi:dTMP kinase
MMLNYLEEFLNNDIKDILMEIIKKFFVIEGLDGAGTSTQAKLLSEKIPGSFLTSEPTGDIIGKLIRKILKKEINVSPLTLAYLFGSDRSEHIFGKEGIIERCNKNQIVISDRYLFSSLAYQTLGVSFEKVYDINKDFPLPEIVFFINTPLEICQKRIQKRPDGKELFEDREMQEKILQNYLKGFSLYKDKGTRIYELDGSASIEDILKEETRILRENNYSIS